MNGPAVRFDHVWKRFRIGESCDSLAELLSAWTGRLFGRRSKTEKNSLFWALQDVDFAVERGEALGIIGPNGAGKSTALKLLAGILRPERGSIQVRGRLAALIEVGAGFHGDLTGRENIFLNGAILGMSRQEIRNKLDAIVSFAGIGRFLDMPVKRYSSGLYARLGFSIAAHVDPEVLLVDEVLSVGDAVFRLRCMDRMREMIESGTTLVFVTHNLEQMQSICHRAVVLDQGRCAFAGRSREAIEHYHRAMSQAYTAITTDLTSRHEQHEGAAELVDLRFVNDTGDETVWARASESVRARLTLRLHKPIRRAVIELNMRANASEHLLSVNSGRDGMTWDCSAGVHEFELKLGPLRTCSGQYFWNARVWDADSGTTELDTPFRFPLVIDDEGRATGLLCVDHEWEHHSRDESTRTETTEP